MLLSLGLFLAPLAWQEAPPEHASPDLRYQLGLRVRQMEIAFESAKTKPKLRRASLDAIERSVSSFFALDLPGAAQALDEARGILEGREDSAYDCLAVTPNAWILEPGDSYRLTISQIYSAELPQPLSVRILRPKLEFEVESLPYTHDFGPITLPEHPTGTRGEWYGFQFGSQSTFSTASPEVIPAARARARAAQSLRRESIDTLAPWVAATTRMHLEFLSQMLRGSLLETRLPGELFLHRTEELLEADQDALQERGALTRWARENEDSSLRLRSGALRGQEWIALPSEAGRQVVRVQIPRAPREGRPPLVIALHGMGGSENMFFDGYGNGKAASLGRTKGWFLAAPRIGAGFDLVATTQQLLHLLDADPQRVFLIGHSMGAAQAIAAAHRLKQAQVPVSGMMLIGGGRTASEGATLDALLELPLFIQPGVRDFARPGAVALIEQLEAAGHPRLTHRIVPDCEHLTVVQVALDQCFEWMQWLLDQRTE